MNTPLATKAVDNTGLETALFDFAVVPLSTNITDSYQHCWQLSRGVHDWLMLSLDKLYQDGLPLN